MGTIVPNSTVYLLRGVPLDNTYQNTIYFASAQAQQNYFLATSSPYYNYSPILINLLSYQRVKEGVLRINRSADSIYNYNYMMFQNTTQNTKWFYAFILDVEYINEQACNVYYEIDVMQTWLFEAQLQNCLVEREHSASDNIDEHIELEDVPLGEYICEQETMESVFSDFSIVITHAPMESS